MELADEDGLSAVPAVLAQPKRLAVLAYLALSSPRGAVPRETVTALLWPEFDEDHARGALRQALSFLRRHLGADVIESRSGASLAISPDRVWCDAIAFERLVDESRFEEALALYRGPLLDGFHPRGVAPEFEHWLDLERERLRRRAGDARWSLASAALDSGNQSGAERWAEAALAADPFSESALRRLLEVFRRGGNRAGALAICEEFATRSRQVLGVELSDETRAAIEAVRAEASHRLPAPTPEPAPLPPPCARATSSVEGAEIGPAADPGAPPPPAIIEIVARDAATPADAAAASVPELAASPAPADGCSTATASSTRTSAATTTARATRRPARRTIWPAALGAGVILAASVGHAAFRHTGDAPGRPQERVLAVAPFEVLSTDTTLAVWRTGAVNALASDLAGSDVDVKVIDPRAAISLWDSRGAAGAAEDRAEAVTAYARELRATRVLVGEILGSAAGEVTVWARLYAGNDGKPVTDVYAHGRGGEVPLLLHWIASQLIAQEAGIDPDDVRRRPEVPITAVRAYLRGRAAYRCGRYEAAVSQFRTALKADSTFAEAALGLALASHWFDQLDLPEALSRAQRFRARLGRRDQALLDAMLTLSPLEPHSVRKQLDAWNRAVQLAPDRADAWYQLGDVLYHYGSVLALPDHEARARRAFAEAAALDSGFVAPIEHLMQIAADQGDRSELLRLQAVYLARDSVGEIADFVRWFGDRMADRNPSGRSAVVDRANVYALRRVLGAAQIGGFGLAEADRAARRLEGLPTGGAGRWSSAAALHQYAINRGRPAAALAQLRRLEMSPYGAVRPFVYRVYDSLYGDAGPDGVRGALTRLRAYIQRPSATPYGADVARIEALCAVAQWEGLAGRLAEAKRLFPKLRAAVAAYNKRTGRRDVACVPLVEAVLAWKRGEGSPRERLEHLIEIVDNAPPGVTYPAQAPLLIAAWWYEALGDAPAALAVLRRRSNADWFAPSYLATLLREEGRLALMVGDTAGAIRAYRHYAALRADPEPRLRADAERVRRQLAALGVAALPRPNRGPGTPGRTAPAGRRHGAVGPDSLRSSQASRSTVRRRVSRSSVTSRNGRSPGPAASTGPGLLAPTLNASASSGSTCGGPAAGMRLSRPEDVAGSANRMFELPSAHEDHRRLRPRERRMPMNGGPDTARGPLRCRKR